MDGVDLKDGRWERERRTSSSAVCDAAVSLTGMSEPSAAILGRKEARCMILEVMVLYSKSNGWQPLSYKYKVKV